MVKLPSTLGRNSHLDYQKSKFDRTILVDIQPLPSSSKSVPMTLGTANPTSECRHEYFPFRLWTWAATTLAWAVGEHSSPYIRAGTIFGSIFAYIHVIKLSGLALLFYNVSLTSIRATLYNMNFGSSQFTSLCFGSLNAIIYPRISFLFLLVFVLPIKDKGPKVLRRRVWFTQIWYYNRKVLILVLS